MLEITQQARRELMRQPRSPSASADIRLLRVIIEDGGRIRIEPSAPVAGDVLLDESDTLLLAIDGRVYVGYAEAILHYRTAADAFEGPEGWVLLKRRKSVTRPGLAEAVPSPEAKRSKASAGLALLRLVWAVVHSLR